jgi:hypothetical protein
VTADTVFCTNCGARNPLAARFCDQCGTPLVKPADTLTVPAPPAAPAAASAAPAPAPVAAGGTFNCPQCGVAAIPGEAFCDNCGAALGIPGASGQPPVAAPPPVAQPAAPAQPAARALPAQPAPPPAAPPPAAPPSTTPALATLASVRLDVDGTPASLALPASDEAIVGRADAASNFQPDIDLTPYGALERGVSRRHVRLALRDGQVTAEDLDSINGTMLNGQRLPARQPTPLANGDRLIVGRLTLIVVL